MQDEDFIGCRFVKRRNGAILFIIVGDVFDLAFARDFFGYVADGVEGQVADHNDDGDLNKQQS